MTDDDATTVRVPIALRRIFDKLDGRKKWLNFADFSREAIREKLTQEQRLAAAHNEAPAEDDPSPKE
jgi:hypothetical protein